MTDREILEEVYRRLQGDDPHGWKTHPKNGVRSFIEQEWQKRDEQELVDQYNRNREAKDHISTTHLSHAEKGEAWESLRIGPDGTVGASNCCPAGEKGEAGEKGVK